MPDKVKKSLIKEINKGYFLGAFFSALVVIAVLLFYSYNSYKVKKETLEKDYLVLQRDTIKKEVYNLIELINFKVYNSEEILKNEIKSQVDQAVNIATSLYDKYSQTLGDKRTKQIIKDALREIRFNEKRGYLFAINMDGTEELFADRPETEGKKLTDMRDLNGRHVVLDMIEIAKKSGEGFYRYFWSKPVSEGLNHEKLSFVKYVPALNWVIGTGEYLEDVQNRVKKEILQKAGTVRFGKSGYIFIFDFKGTYLTHIKKEFIGTSRFWYVDKNGVKVGESLLKESLKPEGGYVEFYWPKGAGEEHVKKISYAKSYDPWEWVICTGFYMDDVEDVLKGDWDELLRDLKKEIFFICILTILLTAISHLIGKYYTGKINSDQNNILHFLRNDKFTEKKEFRFEEFQIMSDEILSYRNLLDKFKNDIIEKNQLYKNILNFLPIPVFLSDGEKMLFMNDSAYEFLKIEKTSDIKDIRLRDFILSDLDCRNGFAHGSGLEIKQKQTLIADSNGDSFDIFLSVKRIKFEDKDAVLCAVEDITEINMAHAEVLKEKELLSAVLENIKEMIFVLDNKGNILIKSKQTEIVVGCMTGCVFGSCFRIFNEGGDDITDSFTEVLKSGDVGYFENKVFGLKAKDNNPVCISVSASKIMFSGDEIGWVIVFRDITEVLQVERNMNNLARLNSVGELAGGIAHNFNNVLGVIMNCINVIEFTDDKNTVEELLKDIKKTVLNARSITSQLITFSKGGEPLKKVFDLNELLNSTLKLSLSGSDIALENCSADEKIMIFADEGQIAQVLQNIIINARQSMNDSGLLSADSYIQDVKDSFYINNTEIKKGSYAVVRIKDTGCGIPEHFAKRIFDPYFTTKQMGTGLGLATSFRIIQKHGGVVAFESGKNGTTFYIFIPAYDSEQKFIPEIMEHKDFNKLSVILMDDEDYIRKSLGIMLEHLGCNVYQASTGEEAIDLFEKHGKAIDVAILDLIVPGGMGGKQCLQELKAMNPRIKCIVSSGYSDDESMTEYKKCGFDSVLPKPYRYEDLRNIISQVVNGGNPKS